MSNASANLTNANVPTRSFGSEHDPVLDGITRGLETLFPPVYQLGGVDLRLELVRDDLTSDIAQRSDLSC
ncbi:hypothetical protein DK419_25855 [Methylobacterium terrae]|uniref:Uncharacterized protein n=1 Tax=Methylobacterium terrae TaxID=2202827 RepID=A0A2U8WT17_9HYPH|nr:hypothetical protein [Methylobacterium terrae]AWN49349.1 hypothetical protein DK419_25855 [Methylobacterium terrae]